MCKSTCSITLTTDMCPAAIFEKSKENGEKFTTHTYTFSPDQVSFATLTFVNFRQSLLSFSDASHSRLHETPAKTFGVQGRKLPDKRLRDYPDENQTRSSKINKHWRAKKTLHRSPAGDRVVGVVIFTRTIGRKTFNGFFEIQVLKINWEWFLPFSLLAHRANHHQPPQISRRAPQKTRKSHRAPFTSTCTAPDRNLTQTAATHRRRTSMTLQI